jgi:hypothetical protein
VLHPRRGERGGGEALSVTRSRVLGPGCPETWRGEYQGERSRLKRLPVLGVCRCDVPSHDLPDRRRGQLARRPSWSANHVSVVARTTMHRTRAELGGRRTGNATVAWCALKDDGSTASALAYIGGSQPRPARSGYEVSEGWK